ncbi:MAG: ferritin-like domain-containing protein [Myxococcota bacterium]
MLLTREEMSFDFAGAKLDPLRDRALLAWIVNQFLYGEITGIQVGHWLYDAPDLESARFLARQAVEEFQHVDNFLRILGMLDCEPEAPHPVVRFMATGMMGDSWAEHVALEMATGEGLVLSCIYALIDTVDHPGIAQILERASKQEERHVDFGERWTARLVASRPRLRRRLLGKSLVSLWAVRRLARFMEKRLPSHPVLSQMPAFLDALLAAAELRLRRMGLLSCPLASIGRAARGALVAEAYAATLASALVSLLALPLRLLPPWRRRRLTETYLDDPAVRALPPSDVSTS